MTLEELLRMKVESVNGPIEDEVWYTPGFRISISLPLPARCKKKKKRMKKLAKEDRITAKNVKKINKLESRIKELEGQLEEQRYEKSRKIRSKAAFHDLYLK